MANEIPFFVVAVSSLSQLPSLYPTVGWKCWKRAKEQGVLYLKSLHHGEHFAAFSSMTPNTIVSGSLCQLQSVH